MRANKFFEINKRAHEIYKSLDAADHFTGESGQEFTGALLQMAEEPDKFRDEIYTVFQEVVKEFYGQA